ncbi:hypothetical protein [Nocardia brasiliensis]
MPDVDPNALVIRFRPMQPQALLDRAARDARRLDGPGKHTASVWCGVHEPGESDEDLRRRILDITVDNGMDAVRNSQYWACARAGDLHERGFSFIKDGYDDEPDAHYSVVLGEPPTLHDVERFLEPFERMER